MIINQVGTELCNYYAPTSGKRCHGTYMGIEILQKTDLYDQNNIDGHRDRLIENQTDPACPKIECYINSKPKIWRQCSSAHIMSDESLDRNEAAVSISSKNEDVHEQI
jgi:hypothetical protein